jgi:hypothetical protein
MIDIAQALRDRIAELERNCEKIVFGHEAAIGELRRILAQVEQLAVEQPPVSPFMFNDTDTEDDHVRNKTPA